MLKSESPLLLPLYVRLATDENLDVIVKLINDALAPDQPELLPEYRSARKIVPTNEN